MADPEMRPYAAPGKTWRHEDVAELLGSLTIKLSGEFLEKEVCWTCPGCGRSKAQIVAPGRNVNIVACIYRHHDHIEDLIATLLNTSRPETSHLREAGKWNEWLEIIRALERQFCRFEPVDICQACNNADAAAKSIVMAPKWFSFSPHGIRNIIHPAKPYAVRHEIDRRRLSIVWDKVSSEIGGLEQRIRDAILDFNRKSA
jgi:hypothetical protein